MDGNFNSLLHHSVPIDLNGFRRDPSFDFLTPGYRSSLDSTEQYLRLLEMGLSDSEIRADLTRLVENSRLEIPENDGRFWRMDVVHYFYRKQIELSLRRDSAINVLEIGGGYGGLARQLLDFSDLRIDSYLIIDLPLTLGLSAAYLRAELSDQAFEKLVFIDAREVDRLTIDDASTRYLGIATHSLSEQDPEVIDQYLSRLLPSCDQFYLSMQRRFHLNGLDFDWLYLRFQEDFRVHSVEVTERLNVISALFGRKHTLGTQSLGPPLHRQEPKPREAALQCASWSLNWPKRHFPTGKAKSAFHRSGRHPSGSR